MATFFILVCIILWLEINAFGNQTNLMPKNPTISSIFSQSEISTNFEFPLDNVTTHSATLHPILDNVDKKIPLYLGGYFSLGGIWDGSGILPAVEMALEHINERTDILAEYELKMIWNDTRVSRPRFFNDLYQAVITLKPSGTLHKRVALNALVNTQLGKIKTVPIVLLLGGIFE